jgi:erythronate-4-phosphate dehydrogenase
VKILADRNMVAVEDFFGELGAVAYFDGRELSNIESADLLLVRSVTRVDEVLLGDHRPRFIGTATSGVDHIDQELLARRAIPFAWAPGSNADSVVDYVLSALCHAGQRLRRLLQGEPLGIVGYGHIGRRLHERLARLGVVCRAYEPWLDPADRDALTALDAVLSCPVVCLHAALTREMPWPSFHMLDGPALDRLPEGALLINAGRGELLATGELLRFKQRRPDVDLVLDVWEHEPHIEAGLLAECLFGTAHIAGYSTDGKRRATAMLYHSACRSLGITPRPVADTAGAVRVDVPPLADAELLCWLVRQVYDIRDDDRLLRCAPPGGFDRLRRAIGSDGNSPPWK